MIFKGLDVVRTLGWAVVIVPGKFFWFWRAFGEFFVYHFFYLVLGDEVDRVPEVEVFAHDVDVFFAGHEAEFFNDGDDAVFDGLDGAFYLADVVAEVFDFFHGAFVVAEHVLLNEEYFFAYFAVALFINAEPGGHGVEFLGHAADLGRLRFWL